MKVLLRAVQQAKQAIDEDAIETRYNSLVKACDILTGLQLSIDFDNGGEVAQILHDYYSGIDMRLLSIHESNSTEMCDLCIKHLKMMKEAWEEIDKHAEENDSSSIPEDLQSITNTASLGSTTPPSDGAGLSVSA